MEWLVYKNCDEETQMFIGVLLILSIVFVTVVVGANWVTNKIKNNDKKSK